MTGAGDGNRTRMASLEDWNSTIELRPPNDTRSVLIDLPTVKRHVIRTRSPCGESSRSPPTPDEEILPSSMPRRTRRLPETLLTAACLAFFAVFLLYPMGFTLRYSFGLAGETAVNPLSQVFENPLLRQAFFNSILIATTTVALASTLALGLAWTMSRWDFVGKTQLSALLLAPILLPPFVGAIGLQQLFARYGALNLLLIHRGWMNPEDPIDWLASGGLPAIILLQVLHFYPVLFLTLSAAMTQLDPSLHESAASLGASGWRVFRTVTLPLVRPGWMAGATVVWIGALTDLGTPLITGYSRVVPVQIFDSLNDLNSSSQGYALVAALLGLIAGVFLATRRFASATARPAPMRGARPALPVARPIRTLLFWGGSGLLLAISVLPHFSVGLVAFSSHWFFSPLPDAWTLSNFREVARHGLTASSIRNSFVFAGLSSVLDLGLGLGIAWLVSRRAGKMAGLLDTLAMLPLAVPGLVLAFGYFAGFEVNEKRHPWLDGWLDPRTNPTFLLVISYAVRRLPYMVRAAFAGFEQMSPALEEASAMLGAGPARTFFRITLPLIGAHLMAGMILTFAFAMLEVSDSLILAQRDRFYPITKQIWQLMGRIDPGAPGVACALGLFGMGLLAVSLAGARRLVGRRSRALFQA